MMLLLAFTCVFGQVAGQDLAMPLNVLDVTPGACPFPDPVLFADPAGDAVIRRTGLNPGAPVDEFVHNKPDIIAYRIGNWQPDAPHVDLYAGCWDPGGNFFRFDVAFLGLVNPPGLWALVGLNYDPFLFGPNPVFGYVSFDVDRNPNSGGEIDVPAFRYLGNVARFGGLPSDPRFADRVATGGADLDDIFISPPFIERSGEEFHIALFGDLFDPGCTSVFEEVGNGDCTFDLFETWLIRAPVFHRAHGYERFSAAGGDGIYEPMVDLRFESAFGGLNVTLVSLVYPLNNLGAAEMVGPAEPAEPLDGDDANQNSILEGLQDLVASVQALPAGDPLRTSPPFALIAPWEFESPLSSMDSSAWNATIMVSMSYVNQDPLGDLFVWTDAAPGPKVGDFNGSGLVENGDLLAFNAFLQFNDGAPGIDGDPMPGSVGLLDFGHNFSMFDLNYDGVVNGQDRAGIVIRGDMDGDFDIDPVDAAIFTQTLVAPGGPPGLLFRADVNEDGAVNGRDIQVFVERLLSQP